MRRNFTLHLEQCSRVIEKTFANAAEMSHLIGNKECFIETARKTLSYNPDNEKIKELAPELAGPAEKISELLKSKISYLETSERNIDVWTKLGHCYALLCDFPNAYATFTAVKEFNKDINDPVLFYSCAVSYQNLGYNIEAIKNYFQIPQEKYPFEIDARFRQSVAMRDERLYDESLKIIDALIASDKLPSYLLRDDLIFQKAFTMQLAGRKDEARVLYHLLLNAYPQSKALSIQYAWFAHKCLTHDEAKAIIDPVYEKYPREKDLILLKALMAIAENEAEQAYNMLKGSVSDFFDCPAFWCILAYIYQINGQDNDAVTSYIRALHINYDIPEAWMNVGIIMEKVSTPQEALTYFRHGYEMTGCEMIADIIQSELAGEHRQKAAVLVKPEFVFTDVPIVFGRKFVETAPLLTGKDLGTSENFEYIQNYPKSPLLDNSE